MTAENNDKDEGTTFGDAINLTGFGKYNFYIAFVCSLVAAAVLLVSLDLSYTLPAAVCDLGLTSSSKAIMTSAVFLGTISASHLSGLLIDVLGRQYVMARSVFITTCLQILTAFAPNFIIFAILKTLIGFVLCASGIALFAYIGESSPANKVSLVIIMTTIIASSSIMFTSGVAWLILPGKWSLDLGFLIFHPWRLFLITTGLPLYTATVLVPFLPESPKFALACGYKDKALSTLRNIYRWNTGQPKEEYPVKCLLDIPEERVALAKNPLDILRRMWSQTFPLFLPPYLIKLLFCSFVYFNIYFCINGIVVWVPEMTNRMSLSKSQSPNTTLNLCEMMTKVMPDLQEFVEPLTPHSYFLDPSGVINLTIPEFNHTFPKTDNVLGSELETDCVVEIQEDIFLPNLLMGVVQPVSMFLVSLIIPLLQKKVAIMVFLLLACLLMISITLVPNIKIIMVMFTSLPPIISVVYNVITSLTVDFFPTNYRGMAVSLSMMFGRLGSIFGNFAFSFMLDSQCQTMFYIFIGFLLLGSVVTSFVKTPKAVIPKVQTKSDTSTH